MNSQIAILLVCILQTISSLKVALNPLHSNVLSQRSSFSLSASKQGDILRKIDNWACIKNCGACCKLGPIDSRPDLPTYLTTEEYELYKSMIGPDDWCIHFDKETRLCKQYDNRPEFCRVDLKKYTKVYDIKPEEFTDFCSFCCTEHIADIYGEDSDEMDRFEETLEKLDSQ